MFLHFIGTSNIVLNNLTIITVSETMLHNPNITYNGCKIITNVLTGSFWINPRGTYNDTEFQHTGNAFIIDNVIANNFKPWCRVGTTNYGEIDGLYISNMNQHQWRYVKPTMPINDTTFNSTAIAATAYSNPHIYICEDAIEWRNVTFLDAENNGRYGGVEMYWNYSYNNNEDAQDEINCYNVTTDRSDGKIRVYFQFPTYPNDPFFRMNFFQPINISTVTSNGEYLNNSIVNIKDSEGTIYTGNTIDGEVSIIVKTYQLEMDEDNADGYYDNATPYYSKTTDLNPMTLTISKEGYDDYTIPITITEETNLEISLNEVTPPIYYNIGLDGELDESNVEGSLNSSSLQGSIITDNISGSID